MSGGYPPAGAVGADADLAVVVFSDACEIMALRGLRRGFRHCFAVLRRGGAWVVVDPLAHRLAVDLAPASLARDAEMVAALYRARGLTALVVPVAEPPRRLAPLRPFTCVEAVKRLIGRRAPWVFTPAQLHAHLLGERQKCKNEYFVLDGAAGLP